MVKGMFETQDWGILSTFLTQGESDALLEDAQLRHTQGEFKPAGIGRGSANTVNPETRSDLTCWWEEGALSPAQQLLWAKILELQENLNQTLFLNLKKIEAHYALYEPGTFYKRHLDSFRGAGNRRVSLVLYLNADWGPDDGGELILYPPGSQSPRIQITPHGGTLVAFLSEEVPHEVLPARKPRWSIAIWMS